MTLVADWSDLTVAELDARRKGVTCVKCEVRRYPFTPVEGYVCTMCRNPKIYAEEAELQARGE